ncbi:hypothetical protein [Uliginosibacterium sp. H1]|uniref:hypothetical protein n=1 Tax=Uliginosibacterium sp. H1 TaxID=3114757 RepID=UPI002E182C52|nr:hypothetical protein [Uliginosibacterium sp. H1]
MSSAADRVYVKTEAGLLELQHRQLRLPPKQRALLVLIDGRQSVTELLATLTTLGVEEKAFTELSMLGLIEAMTPGEAASIAPAVEAQAGTVVAASGPADAVAQVRSLHALYSQAIKDNLGLRGFTMQLQVERAGTVEDFRNLRQPLVDAVKKSKGELSAERLGLEIDKVLATLA